MVSAALLAVVAIGVYAGIDGPTAISNSSRLRSQAAAIAQQDQDRLKSMAFDDLQAMSPTTRTVTLGGLNFTVTSNASWTSDASGTASCTNSSATADYLVLKSTVTWPNIGGATPIKFRSIKAPPTGTGTNLRGNLSVSIIDQATPPNPVTGIPVSISGPTSMTKTTNSAGCAVFAYIPVGTYVATFQQTGWVDPNFNSVATLPPASVTGNNSTILTTQYGRAADVDVKFQDSAGNPANWTSATVSGAQTGAPKQVQSTPAGTFASTLTTGYTLFPFTSGYQAWAGRCPDPTKPPASPANYPTAGGLSAPLDTTPTGQPLPGASATVTARLPTIRLSVTRGGVAYGGAKVVVTPTDPCADAGPGKDATSTMRSSSVAGQVGQIDVPMPYGNYSLCVDDSPLLGAANAHKKTYAGLVNDKATGFPSTPTTTSRLALDIPTSGGKSTCP
jgi:hypothetical protein